jgi:hypothetical protein
MRFLFVLSGAALVGAVVLSGCKELLESCDSGGSGDDRNSCFLTECKINENCDLSDRMLAGSTVPFQVTWREHDDATGIDVTSDDDANVSGSGSCNLDCQWTGSVESSRAGTVTLLVADPGASVEDTLEVDFVRADTVTATVVRDELASDPEVDENADGAAEVSRSDRNIQLRLVAKDANDHELRVFSAGYAVTTTTSGVVITERAGDRFALQLQSAGDFLLHVSTNNTDGATVVDVPLHVTE